MFTQRRHRQRHYIKVVVEILPEPAFPDFLLQIFGRRRDHPDIYRHRLGTPHAQKGMGLENTQQARLGLQIHIGNIRQ